MTDQPQGATLTAAPTETVTTVTTTVITQTAPVDETAHGQAVPVASGEDEIIPGHPDRFTTEEYRQTRRLLIVVLDTPCEICGVRNSTLSDPDQNPHGSKSVETHHYPIQRELADACDYRKVARDYGKYVVDQTSFLKFVDSPANMKCICSHCHRNEQVGIHHATAGDWIIQRYLLDGYVLVDKAANAATDIAIDNAIVNAAVPLSERL